jgi:hypothetical protein
MCMNCGCGQPEDRHGRPANITASDLRAAAEANGQSLRESARHIAETVDLVEGTRGAAPAPDDSAAHPSKGGLAKPAGREPAEPAAHGTPGSES